MPGAASSLRFSSFAPFLLLLGCGSRTGLVESNDGRNDGAMMTMTPETGAPDAGDAGDAFPDVVVPVEAGPTLVLSAVLLRMDSNGPVGYAVADVDAAACQLSLGGMYGQWIPACEPSSAAAGINLGVRKHGDET
jgi:hypothetical protein